MSIQKSTGLFGLLLIVGIMIGGVIATYLFFGVVTLIGFIALVESVGPLKWLVERTASFIDIAIFVITIIATIKLGVTITASLTIAGLGFTLVYAPYVKYRFNKKKEEFSKNQFKK